MCTSIVVWTLKINWFLRYSHDFSVCFLKYLWPHLSLWHSERQYFHFSLHISWSFDIKFDWFLCSLYPFFLEVFFSPSFLIPGDIMEFRTAKLLFDFLRRAIGVLTFEAPVCPSRSRRTTNKRHQGFTRDDAIGQASNPCLSIGQLLSGIGSMFYSGIPS